MATTMLAPESAATHTVEPVVTARRLVLAVAVLAVVVMAFVVGWALRGPGGDINSADCVNPPGPGVWCQAP